MADIETWLAELGLADLAPVFRRHDIDLDVLPLLSDADLREELGLSLGNRRRILHAAAALPGAKRNAANATSIGLGEAPAAFAAAALDPEAVSPLWFAERRQITILFCDLVGSTRISQALDVESYAALLGRYQRGCAEVIARYGGHVAQFLGDGVLAYFGYPVAHEDDCERAVLAGAELVDEARRLEGPDSRQLQVRIGIDTGMVVVGDLRLSPEGDIDSVAGETPNRAARLQTAANPGQVIVGDQTRRILGDFAQFEDLGPRQLKGFTGDVRAWRLMTADMALRGSGKRRREDGNPLIGRSREAAIVEERWRAASDGQGGVIVLTGEAGIGKSRLIRHLVEHLPREATHGFQFRCSSYNRDTAFGPVADALRRAVGFQPRDTTAGRLARLDRMIEAFPGRAAWAFGLIAALCGVPADPGRADPRIAAMTPAERKSATLDLLLDWAVARAATRPLLVVGDDLQWADPSTLELIDRLIAAAPSAPMMVALLHRPDFDCGWSRVPGTTVLALDRFASDQSLALMRAVTGGLSLPEELEAEILEKTDGVPLFIEEVTRSLLDTGALRQVGGRLERTETAQSIDIPATLQDALLARLDRMNAVKDIALWAAALGRRFSLELFQKVGPFSREELFSALEKLTAADILRRGGSAPNEYYEFRHALVREAAYNSMLSDKRRALHRDIVDALITDDPGLMDSDPDLLEHHYQRAGEHAKAAVAAIAAGDRIAARYAGPEARRRYTAALDLVQLLPDDEEGERLRIRVALKLASTSTTGDEISDDLARLGEAVRRAEGIGSVPRRAHCLYWQGRLTYVSGRLDQAIGFASEAAALAEAAEDPRLRSGPDNLLARILCLRGEATRAEETAARNRLDMRAVGDLREETSITGVHAFALASGGRFEEARAVAEEAVAMAERLGHQPTLAANTMFAAIAEGWSGAIATARPWVAESLDVAEACGDSFRRYVTLGWWGESLLRESERTGHQHLAAEARRAFADARSLSAIIGVNFHMSAFLALDALAALGMSRFNEARDLVGQAVEVGVGADQEWGLSIAWQARGRLALAGARPSDGEVRDLVRRAIEVQDRLGLVPESLRSQLLLAALEADCGNKRVAASIRKTAIDVASAHGLAAAARGYLEHALGRQK